jgi:hypothetical protein
MMQPLASWISSYAHPYSPGRSVSVCAHAGYPTNPYVNCNRPTTVVNLLAATAVDRVSSIKKLENHRQPSPPMLGLLSTENRPDQADARRFEIFDLENVSP